MRTKNLLLALGAASALAISTSASAAVVVDDTSFASIDGPATTGDTTTISFDESGLGNPTFSEYLTFTNTIAGLYSFTVSTSSASVDFTSMILTGLGGPYSLNNVGDDGTLEFWGRSGLLLDAGQYTLTLNGNNSGTGTLGGTVTIGQAVPEPATWAMMLLGFGAIGFAMRRRKQAEGTKRIRLSYS